MRDLIAGALTALGVDFEPGRAETLARFADLVLEKNRVMNLTAITEPEQVAALHFADSAAPLACLEGEDLRVIDVGTGAGFPGVPMKILRPDLRMTLLDSQAKRVDFLRESCAALGVEAVCLQGRAEELGLEKAHREQYDCAVSRAVADLGVLAELCLPLVAVDGLFLAMKGRQSKDELFAAEERIELLGGEVEDAVDYEVGGQAHRIYVIRKVEPTPKGYPRRWAKIKGGTRGR